VNKTPLHN